MQRQDGGAVNDYKNAATAKNNSDSYGVYMDLSKPIFENYEQTNISDNETLNKISSYTNNVNLKILETYQKKLSEMQNETSKNLNEIQRDGDQYRNFMENIITIVTNIENSKLALSEASLDMKTDIYALHEKSSDYIIALKNNFDTMPTFSKFYFSAPDCENAENVASAVMRNPEKLRDELRDCLKNVLEVNMKIGKAADLLERIFSKFLNDLGSFQPLQFPPTTIEQFFIDGLGLTALCSLYMFKDMNAGFFNKIKKDKKEMLEPQTGNPAFKSFFSNLDPQKAKIELAKHFIFPSRNSIEIEGRRIEKLITILRRAKYFLLNIDKMINNYDIDEDFHSTHLSSLKSFFGLFRKTQFYALDKFSDMELSKLTNMSDFDLNTRNPEIDMMQIMNDLKELEVRPSDLGNGGLPELNSYLYKGGKKTRHVYSSSSSSSSDSDDSSSSSSDGEDFKCTVVCKDKKGRKLAKQKKAADMAREVFAKGGEGKRKKKRSTRVTPLSVQKNIEKQEQHNLFVTKQLQTTDTKNFIDAMFAPVAHVIGSTIKNFNFLSNSFLSIDFEFEDNASVFLDKIDSFQTLYVLIDSFIDDATKKSWTEIIDPYMEEMFKSIFVAFSLVKVLDMSSTTVNLKQIIANLPADFFPCTMSFRDVALILQIANVCKKNNAANPFVKVDITSVIFTMVYSQRLMHPKYVMLVYWTYGYFFDYLSNYSPKNAKSFSYEDFFQNFTLDQNFKNLNSKMENFSKCVLDFMNSLLNDDKEHNVIIGMYIIVKIFDIIFFETQESKFLGEYSSFGTIQGLKNGGKITYNTNSDFEIFLPEMIAYIQHFQSTMELSLSNASYSLLNLSAIQISNMSMIINNKKKVSDVFTSGCAYHVKTNYALMYALYRMAVHSPNLFALDDMHQNLYKYDNDMPDLDSVNTLYKAFGSKKRKAAEKRAVIKRRRGEETGGSDLNQEEKCFREADTELNPNLGLGIHDDVSKTNLIGMLLSFLFYDKRESPGASKHNNECEWFLYEATDFVNKGAEILHPINHDVCSFSSKKWRGVKKNFFLPKKPSADLISIKENAKYYVSKHSNPIFGKIVTSSKDLKSFSQLENFDKIIENVFINTIYIYNDKSLWLKYSRIGQDLVMCNSCTDPMMALKNCTALCAFFDCDHKDAAESSSKCCWGILRYPEEMFSIIKNDCQKVCTITDTCTKPLEEHKEYHNYFKKNCFVACKSTPEIDGLDFKKEANFLFMLPNFDNFYYTQSLNSRHLPHKIVYEEKIYVTLESEDSGSDDEFFREPEFVHKLPSGHHDSPLSYYLKNVCGFGGSSKNEESMFLEALNMGNRAENSNGNFFFNGNENLAAQDEYALETSKSEKTINDYEQLRNKIDVINSGSIDDPIDTVTEPIGKTQEIDVKRLNKKYLNNLEKKNCENFFSDIEFQNYNKNVDINLKNVNFEEDDDNMCADNVSVKTMQEVVLFYTAINDALSDYKYNGSSFSNNMLSFLEHVEGYINLFCLHNLAMKHFSYENNYLFYIFNKIPEVLSDPEDPNSPKVKSLLEDLLNDKEGYFTVKLEKLKDILNDKTHPITKFLVDKKMEFFLYFLKNQLNSSTSLSTQYIFKPIGITRLNAYFYIYIMLIYIVHIVERHESV